MWVSQADIVAYLKLGPTDAQALFDSAPGQCLINGVEKISKYQQQTRPYPDLIRLMQRHPSRPSIRRVFRAAIEKILRDPTHPQYAAFQKESAKYKGVLNEPSHGQWRIVECKVSVPISWRVGEMAAATPKLTTHPVITMTIAIPSAVSRS